MFQGNADLSFLQSAISLTGLAGPEFCAISANFVIPLSRIGFEIRFWLHPGAAIAPFGFWFFHSPPLKICRV